MSALPKVLVVDDDPVVGRSFTRVLSKKGYVVVTAENGQEALDRIGREEYDLVFTDIKMPGMNGLEVAEQVKARRPWIPVVIVTGYGSEAHEARAEAAGVAGFVNKPLSPEMIEYSARQALRQKVTAAPAAPVSAAPGPAALAASPEPGSTASGALKNVALFLVSPFIGLAYILAFPFVGLCMIAWLGAKAAAKNPVLRQAGRFVGNIGLYIVSPFIGLAYVVLFPFVGLAILAWMGVRALVNRSGSE